MDDEFLKQAIEKSKQSFKEGNFPAGAVVVRDRQPRGEHIASDDDCGQSHPFTRAKQLSSSGKTGCRQTYSAVHQLSSKIFSTI